MHTLFLPTSRYITIFRPPPSLSLPLSYFFLSAFSRSFFSPRSVLPPRVRYGTTRSRGRERERERGIYKGTCPGAGSHTLLFGAIAYNNDGLVRPRAGLSRSGGSAARSYPGVASGAPRRRRAFVSLSPSRSLPLAAFVF